MNVEWQHESKLIKHDKDQADFLVKGSVTLLSPAPEKGEASCESPEPKLCVDCAHYHLITTNYYSANVPNCSLYGKRYVSVIDGSYSYK
jgi:hypothetical protein